MGNPFDNPNYESASLGDREDVAPIPGLLPGDTPGDETTKRPSLIAAFLPGFALSAIAAVVSGLPSTGMYSPRAPQDDNELDIDEWRVSTDEGCMFGDGGRIVERRYNTPADVGERCMFGDGGRIVDVDAPGPYPELPPLSSGYADARPLRGPSLADTLAGIFGEGVAKYFRTSPLIDDLEGLVPALLEDHLADVPGAATQARLHLQAWERFVLTESDDIKAAAFNMYGPFAGTYGPPRTDSIIPDYECTGLMQQAIARDAALSKAIADGSVELMADESTQFVDAYEHKLQRSLLAHADALDDMTRQAIQAKRIGLTTSSLYSDEHPVAVRALYAGNAASLNGSVVALGARIIQEAMHPILMPELAEAGYIMRASRG